MKNAINYKLLNEYKNNLKKRKLCTENHESTVAVKKEEPASKEAEDVNQLDLYDLINQAEAEYDYSLRKSLKDHKRKLN